jgi:hypothetical protein
MINIMGGVIIIITKMEYIIQELGMRILKQVQGTKHGQIIQLILEITALGKSKEKEGINGLMVRFMRATSMTTIFMVKGRTNGVTVAPTLVNGI